MDKKYPIPDFPGYAITKNGEVFSCLHHEIIRGEKGRVKGATIVKGEWKQMIAGRMHHGYRTIVLSKDGKRNARKISRLVLEVFVGKCPQGQQACHENGVTSDDRLVNLRWDTPLNNNNDKKKHGTWQCGEKHGMAKLNNFQVQRIRLMKEVNPKILHREIAKMFGVGRSTIDYILSRKTWKYI